jgi:ABC-2 type transport system ATP-binding protein
MKVLEFDNIHRAYKPGAPVLKGVSFALEPGEVVGLLGRNGAGKTTLIRIAMGMIRAQQGSVRVFGLDPGEQPIEIKQRVGYVSEDQVLPERFTVGEVLMLHSELFRDWDPVMARELLDRFGLSPRLKIKTLSKGQARQVALLCAVSHRPELLILDEPAGGLDPSARREFLETAIRLLSEEGTTILFSSHYMQDVERVAGRVVLLDAGEVLLDSGLDELREAYSVTVLPAGTPAARVRALDGCVRVRERAGGPHAVFRCEPERLQALLEREAGVREAVCTRAPLEELFVELVGGSS